MLDEIRLLLCDRALQPRSILDLNAHIFNLAWTNEALRKSLDAARIVTIDGMAVVWACRLFGCEVRERCNSTEAFRAFILEHDMPGEQGRARRGDPARSRSRGGGDWKGIQPLSHHEGGIWIHGR